MHAISLTGETYKFRLHVLTTDIGRNEESSNFPRLFTCTESRVISLYRFPYYINQAGNLSLTLNIKRAELMDRRISSCFVHPVAKLVITYEKKTPTATKLIFWHHQSSRSVKIRSALAFKIKFPQTKIRCLPLLVSPWYIHTPSRQFTRE